MMSSSTFSYGMYGKKKIRFSQKSGTDISMPLLSNWALIAHKNRR